MARKLKLIPPSAENANGIDFEMHFNPHSQRPDQRAHMDFKGTIKVLFLYDYLKLCFSEHLVIQSEDQLKTADGNPLLEQAPLTLKKTNADNNMHNV